jgi:hypothetical protein
VREIPVRQQVGTEKILEPRVYPRDARQNVSDPNAELVSVDTGVWPVYRDDDGGIYWEMAGKVSRVESRVQTLGRSADAVTFGLSFVDVPTGYDVIFKSSTFTLGEFARFLSEPIAREGAEQRLIFTLHLAQLVEDEL